MTNYEKVRNWHKDFDLELDQIMSKDLIDLRYTLIEEESNEVLTEFQTMLLDSDLQEKPGEDLSLLCRSALLKELVDLLVVAYGTAATFGLPIDEAFEEVMQEQYSKLGEDGKPIKREDGKVLKGPNFKPANIASIVLSSLRARATPSS